MNESRQRPSPAPAPRPRRPWDRRGLIRASLITVAAAGLALVATGVDGTLQLAAPTERAGLPQSSDVLIESAALVCPGQQRVGTQGMRDVSGDVQVAAGAAPKSVIVGLPTTATPATGTGAAPGRVSLLDPSGRSVASTDQRFDPVVAPIEKDAFVLVRAEGDLAPGVVATQSWLRLSDDDRGLAVTPCLEPSADVWLLGGGGGPSRTERVVMTNPGANAVSVRLEIFGAEGPVDTSDRGAVSIPPQSRVSLSLDALAPEEPRPAVHVVATGGVVAAVLNDAWVDGATARGVDDATAAAVPAEDLVVAGVDAAAAGQGETTLRLVNPGSTEAVARVSVLTPGGPVQPAGLRAVRVGAGATLDVPLALAPGSNGLHITSDGAITAAVLVDRRQARETDREGDFGWTPALPPLVGIGGIVLAGPMRPGTTRTLHLAAGSTGGNVTTTVGSGDSERTVTTTVAPGSTASVPLADADRVWLSTTARDIRAVVTTGFDDRGVPYYGIVPIRSAPTTETAVPVRQVTS